MSSFIGHSLMGWTVGVTNPTPKFAADWRTRLLWIGLLIVVAIAPDFDYLVPFLHPSLNQGLRITHSLFFSSLLPILTLIYLRLTGANRKLLLHSSFQLILASFSHITLDLLVGVTVLPIFWPISNHVFKLPFGLLPSAGKVSLTNYYFYYNLGIEMGVLIPLSCCCLIGKSKKISVWGWLAIAILLSISAYFMHWAYGLSR